LEAEHFLEEHNIEQGKSEEQIETVSTVWEWGHGAQKKKLVHMVHHSRRKCTKIVQHCSGFSWQPQKLFTIAFSLNKEISGTL
jgi:hypothetical protein